MSQQEKLFVTKNQHYVPRFYFRNFSNDGKTVNLYNVERNLYIQKVPIAHQCSEDYFYGSNGVVETALGNLEVQFSRLFDKLKKIQPSESLPKEQRRYNKLKSILTSDDFIVLRLFILIQYTRIKGMQTLSDDLLKETLRVFLTRENKPFCEDDLKNIRVNKGVVMAMQQAITSQPLLCGLKCSIFINESTVEYVFSDNPIVLTNPLMDKFSDMANVGLASHGLMIFFPVNTKIAVCLYDPDVYKFEKDINVLKSKKEIDEINASQILSAQKNVYFKSDNLHKEYFNMLLEIHPKNNSQQVHSGPLIGTQNVVIYAHAKQIPSFKLDAFKIKADSLKEMYVAQKNNNMKKLNAYRRNEILVKLVDLFGEKVRDRTYNVGEWKKFCTDVLNGKFGDIGGLSSLAETRP